MTPDELMRTESKLRSIARELSTLRLEAFSIHQRSKANAMTCGSERIKKCEALRLVELADEFRVAVHEFESAKGGA